jgi:hypothetical protein
MTGGVEITVERGIETPISKSGKIPESCGTRIQYESVALIHDVRL